MKELVWNEIRMGVAPASRVTPRDERVLRNVHERGPRAVGERYRDPAAHAGADTLHERGENADRGVLSGNHVSQSDADLHWVAARLARYCHPATLCLCDEVIAGAVAVGAKTRDCAPDQLGSPGADIEIVTQLARVAGTTGNSEAYGQTVANLLTPDILQYCLGTPASFSFAARNGRRLSDDVTDVVLSLMTNSPLSDSVGYEGRIQPDFPYVATPHLIPADEAPAPLRAQAKAQELMESLSQGR